MKLPRREFLKMTAAGSTAVALGGPTLKAIETTPPENRRELYELRVYWLKPGAPHALLDGYVEKALVPAFNRHGVARVGVFTELAPKDAPSLWLLVPYVSAGAWIETSAAIDDDPALIEGAADYRHVAKDHAAFERIDSWLLHAFAGFPKLALPSYAEAKQPRVYELRTYESFSEEKAAKKIKMFNSGEIEVMRETGLAPVFYGQALTGRDLPHLTYMLSATDADAHKQHWDAFRAHPTWLKMKADPEYADTVSKITSRMLLPTVYSQI